MKQRQAETCRGHSVVQETQITRCGLAVVGLLGSFWNDGFVKEFCRIRTEF